MKTVIVYSSQTGFTKRYAEWLGEELGAAGEQTLLLSFDEAKKQDTAFFKNADAIVYGGWTRAGKVVGSEWFYKNANAWKSKKLAVMFVGASPAADPDINEALKTIIPEEHRAYIRPFYCQGGLNYENMKLPSRLAMKAFASTLRKKKDASARDRSMGKMIQNSYDISDRAYIKPLVNYLNAV